MSKAAEKLAKRLTTEGIKTVEYFSELPSDIWEKPLYSEGASWNVRQVLAHIVETETALPRLFKHIVEGGSGVDRDFDLNEYNERTVEEITERDPAKLVSMFSERREETIKFVGGLSDKDLGMEGYHPFLGQAEIKEMIRLFYLHVQLHMRDVRALGQREQE
ncbi:MAG: DinB family protein [Chloroflexota bacterium]